MPSIKDAIAANQARIAAGGETGTGIAPTPEHLVSLPAPPQLDLPIGLPQRGIFPADIVLASDRSANSREFRSMGMRSSTFPYATVTPPVTKATVVNNITNSSAATALILQTNNSKNPVQNVLNLLAGSGIQLVPDSSGGVTIVNTGTSDAIIHGTAFWEPDAGNNIIRDDFYGPFNSSNQTAGGISTGWSFQNANGTLYSQNGQAPLYGGEIGWSINSTAAETTAGNWFTFSNVTYTSGTANNFLMALLDNPGWRLTFVFRFTRNFNSSIQTSALDLTNRAFYLGLASTAEVNQTNRPRIFMGLRFDKDTTSPSINDTTFHFEVVNNGWSGTGNQPRNNTQGSTFDTGVAPAEDTYYRLDITCATAGTVSMSLNGSAAQTFTMPKSSISSSAGGATGSANGVDEQKLTLGPLVPWGPGSKFTVSGATSGDTVFNGSWTADQTNNTDMARYYTGASQANHSLSGTVNATGYPAFLVAAIFGNTSTGSATANTAMVLLDFCSLDWNPGFASGGTPDSTKARYW